MIIFYLVLLLSVIGGALIDARMWNDKKDDKPWLVRYTDFIWLANWNILTPFMWILVGMLYGWSLFSVWFACKFFVAAFGMSVFWDAVFVRMETPGQTVWVRPIRVWSALPWWGPDRKYNEVFSVEKQMLIIGFNTVEAMHVFNSIRIMVLIGSTFI